MLDEASSALEPPEYDVGILGATSFMGGFVMAALAVRGVKGLAVSRQDRVAEPSAWCAWATPVALKSERVTVPLWISLMPIGALPRLFPVLEAAGVRRLVAISTTSVFTKARSSDPAEREAIASHLAAEDSVRAWAERHSVDWVILRPTMVYGAGRDLNVSRIGRFIRRFGFFPVVGGARGLRQPVHAEDVASACVAALFSVSASGKTLTLSGGEVLTYADMVRRIAVAAGRTPRLLSCPVWVFRIVIALARLLPRYRLLSAAMAERMVTDMVFSHAEAAEVLKFQPRRFEPED